MTEAVKTCPNCWKALNYCICGGITPFPNKVEVLILQHPQESRNPLTTSPLIALALQNCVYRVGFSWRSLKAALKKEASPDRWAVLFVGTQKSSQKISGGKDFSLVDKKGVARTDRNLEGIVVLDGNWKQAKTLWWRNPWLLKLNRIVLDPQLKSLYGELRKEPRAGLLSTLEATAVSLEGLGDSPQVKGHLLDIFQKQVTAWKQPLSEPKK